MERELDTIHGKLILRGLTGQDAEQFDRFTWVVRNYKGKPRYVITKVADEQGREYEWPLHYMAAGVLPDNTGKLAVAHLNGDFLDFNPENLFVHKRSASNYRKKGKLASNVAEYRTEEFERRIDSLMPCENKTRNTDTYTSRYRGVSYDAVHRRYKSAISFMRQCHRLGSFTIETEAAIEYDRAVVKLDPENIERLNFPEKLEQYRRDIENGWDLPGRKYEKKQYRFHGIMELPTGKFKASIYLKGSVRQLGRFSSDEAAAKAWDYALVRYRREEAPEKLNFPDFFDHYVMMSDAEPLTEDELVFMGQARPEKPSVKKERGGFPRTFEIKRKPSAQKGEADEDVEPEITQPDKTADPKEEDVIEAPDAGICFLKLDFFIVQKTEDGRVLLSSQDGGISLSMPAGMLAKFLE